MVLYLCILFIYLHFTSNRWVFLGNPRVTPEITRDVCLLARMKAAQSYYAQIDDLMFEVLDSVFIVNPKIPPHYILDYSIICYSAVIYVALQ